MSHTSRSRFSSRTARLLFSFAAVVSASLLATPAWAADTPLPGASVSAGAAQVGATVAVEPSGTVSAQVSTPASTGASATVQPVAQPKPVAAVKVKTPAGSAGASTASAASQKPAATVHVAPAAAPAATPTAVSASLAAAPNAQQRAKSDDVTAVRASQHTVSKHPASRRDDAPPHARALDALATSPAAAHTSADATAAGSEPQAPLSPAWPQVPAGTIGFGGSASAGTSSPLLLAALILSFFLLALPSLGAPLPMRTRELRAARLLFRLERPG